MTLPEEDGEPPKQIEIDEEADRKLLAALPRPSSLNTRAQEVVWNAFKQGCTYDQMAEAAGVSTGTVSSLVRKWRKEFGPDYGQTGRRFEAAAKTKYARSASVMKWEELRTAEAEKIITSARICRVKIDNMMRWVNKPENEYGIRVKPSDIKALVDSLDKLYRLADQLNAPQGWAVDEGADEGVVDPLLGAAATPKDLLQAMETMRKVFVKQVQGSRKTPIEVRDVAG